MADRWDNAAVGRVGQIAVELTSADAAVAVLRQRYPEDASVVRLAGIIESLSENCRHLIAELRG